MPMCYAFEEACLSQLGCTGDPCRAEGGGASAGGGAAAPNGASEPSPARRDVYKMYTLFTNLM